VCVCVCGGGGLGKLKSSANNWIGVGLDARGQCDIEHHQREAEEPFGLASRHFIHLVDEEDDEDKENRRYNYSLKSLP